MPLGPVFRHEMIAAGRKRRYMVLRVLVGAILLALLAMCYSTAQMWNTYGGGGESIGSGLSIAAISQLTAQFYASFAWWTLLGVLLITPAIAAGAIATERERRTIEYLFTTDLSNSEIVLDKLVARLLTVGQIVLAAFPLLAIFRLLGGVPGDLVLIHFAMLASSATLVAAISIAVSTWCERARDAVPRAYGRVFLLLIAPSLVQFLHLIINELTPSSSVLRDFFDGLMTWITVPLEQFLITINPIYILATAGGVSGSALGVDLDLMAIGQMIAGQLLLASACLALSIFSIRKIHLNSTTEKSRLEKKTERRYRPLPLNSTNPVLWREWHSSMTSSKVGSLRRGIGIALGTLAFLLMIGVKLWTVIISARPNGWEDYFQFAAIMVGFMAPIILLLIGCRAAGLITYEKERETWVSLLATPLSSKEIILGKLLGNLWVYRWPLAAIITIPAAGLIVRGDTWLATIGVLLTTIVVAWAASAIGLLLSLWCKSSLKAIGITIGILVGIGGAYLPFVFLLAATFGLGGDEEMVILMSPCVPFLCVAPIAAYSDVINEDVPMITAYVIGTIGYAVLALLATGLAIGEFNSISSNSVWKNSKAKGEASKI